MFITMTCPHCGQEFQYYTEKLQPVTKESAPAEGTPLLRSKPWLPKPRKYNPWKGTPKTSVLFQNNTGVKIIREDYVKRTKISVLKRSGIEAETFRCNNIPFYEHPYLSWENLIHKQTWDTDLDYRLNAVQDGKCLAFYTSYEGKISVRKTKGVSVLKGLNPITLGQTKYLHVAIAKDGCLADYFDLDEIIEAFRKQGVKLDKKIIEPYFKVPIVELVSTQDKEIPGAYEEALEGLAFGYPIETTAWTIYRWWL